MIERLARAIKEAEEEPPGVQERIARNIERYIRNRRKHREAALKVIGAWSDLPDDMEETLMRWRHEVPPTPPMDEQLAWMDEMEDE